ncbi:MAG TPA: hypothetical protein VFU05_06890 [Cyclobacteriaceae bacterium]|nr:hypothetical protein [Cyclobacteriaceae bacterium]
MKFLIQLITIGISAFILELVMPWWCIAIVAFAAGYALKSKANFLAGLFGIGLLWLIKAWMLDASASAPLTERVAAIFSLSKPLLMLVTALVGGLVGGFAAMTGASLKKAKRSDSYYPQ